MKDNTETSESQKFDTVMRKIHLKIKHATFLAISVIALSAFVVPQDIKHAPTLDSCTADVNLWSSGMASHSAHQMLEATKSLTVHEMEERIVQLGDCYGAYPALRQTRVEELPVTIALQETYQEAIYERLFNFLARHNLSAEFQKEDEAGTR